MAKWQTHFQGGLVFEMNIRESMKAKFQASVSDYKIFDNIQSFVLLFSGGKDCSFLLDMLLECYPDIVSKMETLCVMYPAHVYHDTSGERSNFRDIKSYWKLRGVNIRYETSPYPDFEDNDEGGCAVCKRSRKAIIDPFVNDKENDVGILTGLTLCDAWAYYISFMCETGANFGSFGNLPEDVRVFQTKTLHKLIPRENLPSGKTMLRPLLRFSEKEINGYLLSKGVPRLTTSCKIDKFKIKRLLSPAFDRLDLPSYEELVANLLRQGVCLEDLTFDEMSEDSFFIDC